MEVKNNWVITFSNSENVNVYFYYFFGTENELKEVLCKIAIKHSKEDGSDLVYCPEIQMRLIKMKRLVHYIAWSITRTMIMFLQQKK